MEFPPSPPAKFMGKTLDPRKVWQKGNKNYRKNTGSYKKKLTAQTCKKKTEKK